MRMPKSITGRLIAAQLGGGPDTGVTLVFRLRALNVVTLALREPTYLSCDLVEAIGSHYMHQQDDPCGCPTKYRLFGLMFEAMGVLGKNDVLPGRRPCHGGLPG